MSDLFIAQTKKRADLAQQMTGYILDPGFPGAGVELLACGAQFDIAGSQDSGNLLHELGPITEYLLEAVTVKTVGVHR